MLSDDQIDYLFQIKQSTPPIPDRTLRVMLKALRWSPEEIEHGLAFLKRPPLAAAPRAARVYVPLPPEPLTPLRKSISIKQDPFPIESRFVRDLKNGVRKARQEWKHATHVGVIVGAIIFLVGLLVYARFMAV